MNATTAPDIPSRIAQSRQVPAPVLRSDRLQGVPSFANTLAERAGSGSSIARGKPEQVSREDPGEPRDPPDAEVGGVAASDHAGPSENASQMETPLSDEAEIPGPMAVASDPDAATAIEPSTSIEAVLGVRGIIRELTHAATVDLAQLAGDELVSAESSKLPVKTLGKFPGGSDAPLTAAPTHPHLSGSAGGGTSPQSGADSGQTGADAAKASMRVMQEVEPVRPAIPDGGVTNSTEPARAEAVRVQGGVVGGGAIRSDQAAPSAVSGSVELLTRLTGSAEAARGAIEGVSGAGGEAVNRDARAVRTGGVPAGMNTRAAREQVLTSVQRGLASMLTQGGGRMTVVLRPEQLGEVRVRMEAKDGVMNARMSASTEAARQALEAGLDSLRAALESRGVRVESLEIEMHETSGDERARLDADGRGGGHHSHRHGSERGPGNRERADGPVRGEAAPSTQGIWTEIGIDAVA